MSIKKIIAIGSAKGGVGKSSITASLAVSMSKSHKVGILDADIYTPNQHILFEIDPINSSSDNKKLIKPFIKNNIHFLSAGLIFNPNEAILWRGPILSSVTKKLISRFKDCELDYLLIDMPPGTGDSYLTIFNEFDVDEFILITTPNKLSISDSIRTISLLKKLKVKILGCIENNILGLHGMNVSFFKKNNINFLGTIGFEEEIYNFNYDQVPDSIKAISDKIIKSV